MPQPMENCMLTNSKDGLLKAASRSLPTLPSPMQVVVRLVGIVATWERRARERRMLAEMPERMLKDIGINRLDAHRESDKPFWRG